MAAAVLLAAACSSTGAAIAGASTGPVKAVSMPDTPVGTQLRWLIAAAAHLPLSGAQVRSHFDAAFLAQVSPAMLNRGLHAVVIVRLLSIEVSEPSTLIAVVSATGVVPRAQVALTVDSRGLISRLSIGPATTAPTPATWARRRFRRPLGCPPRPAARAIQRIGLRCAVAGLSERFERGGGCGYLLGLADLVEAEEDVSHPEYARCDMLAAMARASPLASAGRRPGPLRSRRCGAG